MFCIVAECSYKKSNAVQGIKLTIKLLRKANLLRLPWLGGRLNRLLKPAQQRQLRREHAKGVRMEGRWLYLYSAILCSQTFQHFRHWGTYRGYE